MWQQPRASSPSKKSSKSSMVPHTPGAPPSIHTKSEDFGGGVYNHEQWNDTETAVALVGLSLSKCRNLQSEEEKLKYALQYWVEQSVKNKDGMVVNRMPTLDELKRFSHRQGANSRAESLALDDAGPARKRAKTSKRDFSQTFHGDPSGNLKFFLAWPLTQAMVESEANTSRRLRAYGKILPGSFSNAQVKRQLLERLIRSPHGRTGSKKILAPSNWNTSSTVKVG